MYSFYRESYLYWCNFAKNKVLPSAETIQWGIIKRPPSLLKSSSSKISEFELDFGNMKFLSHANQRKQISNQSGTSKGSVLPRVEVGDVPMYRTSFTCGQLVREQSSQRAECAVPVIPVTALLCPSPIVACIWQWPALYDIIYKLLLLV